MLTARFLSPIRLILLAAVALGGNATTTTRARGAAADYPYVSWQDEFDGTAIKPALWTHDIGTGSQYGLIGWGNNERQYYTDRTQNASVGNGMLTIRARAESFGGMNYTSARLKTQGLFSQMGGRFEMRAALPVGRGFWPAFWMLPEAETYGGWAASGEIDIMEARGQQPARVAGTIHYGGSWPNNESSESVRLLPAGQSIADFHTYALEWDVSPSPALRWYVDDVLYATKTSWWSAGGTYPAPFDKPFSLLVNLAVGGNYPGPPDASTPFPSQMLVDSVRVFTAAPPAITFNVASGLTTQAAGGRPSIPAAAAVTKTGAGTVVFDAANVYSAPTTIEAGTLRVANASGLTASPVTVKAGAALAIAAPDSTTLADVTLDAGGVVALRNDAPQLVSMRSLDFGAAIPLTVDRAVMTHGYRNVYELPAKGGAYVGGQVWPVADLRATFTSGTSVTLAPCVVSDTSSYWYTPSGRPGAAGNKTIEANVYGQADGTYAGQTVRFSGAVAAHTLLSGSGKWAVRAFIRDFAPDYSSMVESQVPLSATGEFSVSMTAINDPARHVQWGLQTTGPNVWITDLASKGVVVVNASSATIADGGRIDVGRGSVTVAAGLSPADLMVQLRGGRGDGSWSGAHGVTSTAVAADAARGVVRTVGWLDLGAGAVQFAYAAPGDTNLDWQIDLLDAANVLAFGRFNTGQAATWGDGDFNYDGVVDVLDAADFMSTDLYDRGGYNLPAGAAGVAAVPEPSMWAAAWAAAIVGLVRQSAGRRDRLPSGHCGFGRGANHG
ncbi:MAG: family 16 glycosylhydrolase [Planctomycetaceae bacterium]